MPAFIPNPYAGPFFIACTLAAIVGLGLLVGWLVNRRTKRADEEFDCSGFDSWPPVAELPHRLALNPEIKADLEAMVKEAAAKTTACESPIDHSEPRPVAKQKRKSKPRAKKTTAKAR